MNYHLINQPFKTINQPSIQSTNQASRHPSIQVSNQPTNQPTKHPTNQLINQPTYLFNEPNSFHIRYGAATVSPRYIRRGHFTGD